jgi:hypothetical protein
MSFYERAFGAQELFRVAGKDGKIVHREMAICGSVVMTGDPGAVPWRALKLDTVNHRFTLDVSKEKLKNAPGFDKDHWPTMADKSWATDVHTFYGVSSSFS